MNDYVGYYLLQLKLFYYLFQKKFRMTNTLDEGYRASFVEVVFFYYFK